MFSSILADIVFFFIDFGMFRKFEFLKLSLDVIYYCSQKLIVGLIYWKKCKPKNQQCTIMDFEKPFGSNFCNRHWRTTHSKMNRSTKKAKDWWSPPLDNCCCFQFKKSFAEMLGIQESLALGTKSTLTGVWVEAWFFSILSWNKKSY